MDLFSSLEARSLFSSNVLNGACWPCRLFKTLLYRESHLISFVSEFWCFFFLSFYLFWAGWRFIQLIFHIRQICCVCSHLTALVWPVRVQSLASWWVILFSVWAAKTALHKIIFWILAHWVLACLLRDPDKTEQQTIEHTKCKSHKNIIFLYTHAPDASA